MDRIAPAWRQQLQAILLACFCSVLFLRDALLPGRALVPYPPELYDVFCEEAAARGALDVHEAARGNVSMGDKYAQSLCWDRVLQDRLRQGSIPLWTNDIGGGASFVPQMAQVYQPINLLLLLLPSAQWYGWWWLLHQVLFGWLCYRFLRRIGCAHQSALLGLVCAVLGLWTQCKIHHNVILTAALPLWPMLSSVHAILRQDGRARASAALGLWTGISWLSGFAVISLQVSYLTAAFAVLLVLGEPPGQRWRRLGLVALGLCLGGLLSLAQMIPVLLAAADSSRPGMLDPASLAATAIEWDHALTLLWPDLLSWAGDVFHVAEGAMPLAAPTRIPWSQLVLLSRPEHGGSFFQNWVETSFAIGLPALGAATLALQDRDRRPLVWFFAAAAGIAFAIASATQPFFWLARLAPGLAAADLRRLVFVVAMSLVVLAALGADSFLRGGGRRPAFVLLGAATVGSALALGWLLTREPDTTFVEGVARLIAADSGHEQVRRVQGDAQAIAAWIRGASKLGPDGRNLEAAANLAMLEATAWRALLAGGAGLLALLLRRRTIGLALVLATTMAELLHAGLGPVQTVAAQRITTPPAVLAPVLDARPEAPGVRPRLQRLAREQEPRVAAFLPPNLPGYFGVEDAAAYNPLPPRRMEEFFSAIEPDRRGKTSVAFGGAGVGAFHDAASLAHPLCDLFGIRFVLTELELPASPALVERTPAHTGRFRLYERTTTLPRATMVFEVDVVPERARRLEVLGDRSRDVAARVVLEQPVEPLPADRAGARAEVAITTRDDERVAIAVRTSHEGWLRLADPYDPGWQATVDGNPAPVLIADHYLRAVRVPAGEHVVEFRFDGRRVRWPVRLSLLALGCIALLLLSRSATPDTPRSQNGTNGP